LRFDPAEVGAHLIAHLRNRRPHLVEIELAAAQLAAIFDKRLRDLRTESPKHESDGGLKERAVGPRAERPWYAGGARRKQGWRRKSAFDFADDDLGVAVDVGVDLHHRRATIAAAQRHQIGLRHDRRNAHAFPRKPFVAKDHQDFLGERRPIEMMENDGVGHDRSSNA
jgi:hypothetical protein